MLSSVLHIILVIVFFYFSLSVAYLFLFSIMGKLFYRERFSPSTAPLQRIAILVPSYKEDGIILSTAKNLLSLNYPKDLFDVYILADSFMPGTIQELSSLPLEVLEVHFDKSTKTKSLNEAFKRISKPYDIALICDADNMLSRDFLLRIDGAFANGARAIQGRRVAKNLDTSFAILDACSEAINNNIFRRGANALGLSSAVIGSGMAFEYNRIKKVLSEIDAVGGFDKPLQLKIVAQGIKIQYLEGAIVFDEKVESSGAFKQQRKRWVSSQFIYLKEFFIPSLRQLFKGNVSYFNLAFANNIVLPRAFLLFLLPLITAGIYFYSVSWGTAFLILFLIYLLTLAVALPVKMVNRNLAQAFLHLPGAIAGMIMALFQMKKANKTFIHTVHTKTEVSNTLFNDHGN
jgi:cellulose synthase/poly-beta-1,6-N-acetylglucosamine synthase-like glycosyltransferase